MASALRSERRGRWAKSTQLVHLLPSALVVVCWQPLLFPHQTPSLIQRHEESSHLRQKSDVSTSLSSTRATSEPAEMTELYLKWMQGEEEAIEALRHFDPWA